MSREVHVQFCERVGVKLPCATHLVVLCRGTALRAKEKIQRIMTTLKANGEREEARIVRVPEESFAILGYTIGRCYRCERVEPSLADGLPKVKEGHLSRDRRDDGESLLSESCSRSR